MKAFTFDLTLTIEAKSKREAKERAANALQNLKEMAGYSPFSCQLDLLESSCQEVEYVDEEDYEE